MLLRSTSSPIPNSWLPQSIDPDHTATAAHPKIRRSRSAHLTTSPTPRQALTKALSEGDLTDPSTASKTWRSRGSHGLPPPIPMVGSEEGDHSPKSSLIRLLSSSGLTTTNGADEYSTVERDAKTLIDGGGCGGGGGRKVCGGDGGGGFSFSDADAYYQKTIEANPGDSLVLGNYAKFLKEVRGDLEKAVKYCERAIVADPGNADALSLYADLVWQTCKDAERAERYFDQAVQAAPEDHYVMASYAQFLWDAEDEEEDEEAVKERSFTPASLFDGSTMSSAAVAS